MKVYILQLFPKYIFVEKKKELQVFSLYQKRFLKKYFSTLKRNYRYKLKTKYGHYLQRSTKQIIREGEIKGICILKIL